MMDAIRIAIAALAVWAAHHPAVADDLTLRIDRSKLEPVADIPRAPTSGSGSVWTNPSVVPAYRVDKPVIAPSPRRHTVYQSGTAGSYYNNTQQTLQQVESGFQQGVQATQQYAGQVQQGAAAAQQQWTQANDAVRTAQNSWTQPPDGRPQGVFQKLGEGTGNLVRGTVEALDGTGQNIKSGFESMVGTTPPAPAGSGQYNQFSYLSPPPPATPQQQPYIPPSQTRFPQPSAGNSQPLAPANSWPATQQSPAQQPSLQQPPGLYPNGGADPRMAAVDPQRAGVSGFDSRSTTPPPVESFSATGGERYVSPTTAPPTSRSGMSGLAPVESFSRESATAAKPLEGPSLTPTWDTPPPAGRSNLSGGADSGWPTPQSDPWPNNPAAAPDPWRGQTADNWGGVQQPPLPGGQQPAAQPYPNPQPQPGAAGAGFAGQQNATADPAAVSWTLRNGPGPGAGPAGGGVLDPQNQAQVPERPWEWLVFASLAALASLAANLYLGMNYIDLRNKFRSALRRSGRGYTRAAA